MLVEIHILQNHSPSNLNRDDLGAPKTAIFGKTLRARISSQCLKRSIRTSEILRDALKSYLGVRTKYFPEEVGNALKDGKLFPDEAERAKIVVACTRIADDKENKEESGDDAESIRPKTEQLIFLGPNEVTAFVGALARLKQSMPTEYKRFLKKGEIKIKDAKEPEAKVAKGEKEKEPSAEFWHEIKKSYNGSAVDIALFGRMTTSNAFENVEASMEVAHAISTHELNAEVDYYTAMDDRGGEGPGAGHIGETQYNSATYYKYFSLDWNSFVKALGGNNATKETEKLAETALRAFIEAAVFAMPSGKKKGFANNNLPDGVLIEVKARNIPTNYANAFLKPALAGKNGDLMDASIRGLDDYVGKVQKGFAIGGQRCWWSATYLQEKTPFESASRVATLDEIIKWTSAEVKKGGKA